MTYISNLIIYKFGEKANFHLYLNRCEDEFIIIYQRIKHTVSSKQNIR